jgi:hypothetical protein
METQTVEAVASPAVMEASRGPVVNMTPEQRTEWRKTGNLPEPPKTEAPAASTEEPQETTKVETEVKPEPTKPQERRKPDAEQRIKQLTDRIKELEGAQKPAKVETPVEQPKAEPQYTRSKPTVDDKDGDKPKYATYEDFVEDLSDWKAEQRIASSEKKRQQEAQQQAFKSRVDEAKARYGDKFEEVLAPAVNAIIGDDKVSGVVKTMLNESEVLPDLMFTIGSDAKELADFVKMAKENPGKALRYIALTESLIREELESNSAKTEPKETPVKPVTQAPRPPAEVGGRAATPGDALEAAAKANDFRSFKAEATRRQLAKMKG